MQIQNNASRPLQAVVPASPATSQEIPANIDFNQLQVTGGSSYDFGLRVEGELPGVGPMIVWGRSWTVSGADTFDDKRFGRPMTRTEQETLKGRLDTWLRENPNAEHRSPVAMLNSLLTKHLDETAPQSAQGVDSFG